MEEETQAYIPNWPLSSSMACVNSALPSFCLSARKLNLSLATSKGKISGERDREREGGGGGSLELWVKAV